MHKNEDDIYYVYYVSANAITARPESLEDYFQKGALFGPRRT